MVERSRGERHQVPVIDKPHFLIVEARYYADISDLLLKGAKRELDKAAATYDTVTVPGALEIPPAIRIAIRSLDFVGLRRRYDGYIALGCVIRGETHHFDIVAGESARGLMNLALEHTLCLGNGILTVENRAQAIERADPAKQDKGGDAARASLALVGVKRHFGFFPR
ncbi:MAG: 6,7-dimethyl-8-ribityllumazine synthase [Alphaproteobacteria bacterium]|nr:6,7-dimethyl-8-ribityllumazine synthase [Alphaproteobacteria bacterium]